MAFHYVNGIVLASFEQASPAKSGKMAAKKLTAAPSKQPKHFDIIFTNQETKEQIRLTIPATGVYHDPKKKTTLKDVHKIATDVCEILKKHLD